MSKLLMTRKDCLEAIDQAEEVFIKVDFVNVTSYINVTKKEARFLVMCNINENDTPHALEMGKNSFGEFDNWNRVYLG